MNRRIHVRLYVEAEKDDSPPERRAAGKGDPRDLAIRRTATVRLIAGSRIGNVRIVNLGVSRSRERVARNKNGSLASERGSREGARDIFSHGDGAQQDPGLCVSNCVR